jgi:uncharacterized protein YigE (DUF2233 family)
MRQTLMTKYGFFLLLISWVFCFGAMPLQTEDVRFLSYVAEPSDITFHWKDDKGQILRSIQNLKLFIEGKGKELKFAMNGGMYTRENSPQGLFIEGNITYAALDTLSGGGNFYLKPNGVFYLTNDGKAIVCRTTDFMNNPQIKFATQSGPMLLIDGEVHPAFKKGSANLNIRNGVGILPDNKVIFAISKVEVNFHDFAEYFKSMNCKNALYLDGFVSRAYLPEKNWNQLDGNFGVIIGVSK